LESNIILADKDNIMLVSGNGEAIEMETGIASVGSGSKFALSAAIALYDVPDLTAGEIVRRSMKIAGDLCVFTNHHLTVEKL
jgi:ATP-dependent HslUV protease subunit HslV